MYLVYHVSLCCIFTNTLSFDFQNHYKTGNQTIRDTLFSKWGTIYLFLVCFGIPVLVNGFCHTSIAIVLVKSMKGESQLRNKLVLFLPLNNDMICKVMCMYIYIYMS